MAGPDAAHGEVITAHAEFGQFGYLLTMGKRGTVSTITKSSLYDPKNSSTIDDPAANNATTTVRINIPTAIVKLAKMSLTMDLFVFALVVRAGLVPLRVLRG
jgi:hypothetical protein